MTRRIEERKLKAEIARLRDLDLPGLRTVWQKHYGTRAPKTLRRKILILSIAWRIQADTAGGLKPATRKYLRQVAEGVRSGTVVRSPSAGRIKPGTTLIRVWQDKTHIVTALADGTLQFLATSCLVRHTNGYLRQRLKV
jgi:plastocyanin